RYIRRMRVALAAAFLLACNHSADPATPLTPPPGDTHAGGGGSGSGSAAASDPTLDHDLAKLAKLSVGMYKDMGAAFTVAGADCKPATQKLGELAKQYRDVPIANAKVLHDHRAKDMRAALAPFQAELDTAGQSIASSKTLATCSGDKAFEDAFDKL